MFKEPLKMKNAIQPYAWGSVTAIAELQGRPAPANEPEAELWMGAHPKAPSQVWYQDRWHNLDDLIREDPLPILGRIAVDRFGPQVPFLFKILAVQHPLSIQAHPDKAMAEQGFARENQLGIALTAPHRNYRDAQHKPECVVALTQFTALCGFRDISTILDLLKPIWPKHRQNDLDPLYSKNQAAGLQNFFNHLMALSKDRQRELVGNLVSAANQRRSTSPGYQWMVRLHTAYPGDIGVLSPCFLHLVTLEAGQALFLKAGRLHAYLKGVAIEVMANSDNVLRGGLTPKHVDVDELLNVVDFTPEPLEILIPDPTGPAIKRYPSFADEFELETMDIRPSHPYDSGPRVEAPEIVLCVEGQVKMQWGDNGYDMTLARGESVIVPAQLERYRLGGDGQLYKAGIHHRLFGQPS
jgi:mannose-6-phosphate isomerase